MVNDKLLLNLGVRYDYEETPTFTDYRTPQRFIDAIFAQDQNGCFGLPDPPDATNCPNFFFNGAYRGALPGQTYADTLANAGININDYISDGSNRSNPSDQIAPRFGFSYDLFADQEHVVFGGAARSYDRNTFSILQHETNKATLYTPTVQFWNANNPACLPNTQNNDFCIPWDDAYRTPEGLATIAPGNFGEMHFINNKLKAPYADQFTLGMRNRINDWNTSVAVAYIESHDGVIASPANFFGDGTWYWYDTFHYSLNEALIANAGGGGLFLFDNAKETKTTQVLMSFDKPYTSESGWSASIAYTYSWAKEKLEFNGDYQLDYPFADFSPFVLSSQVPKNRLVAIGTAGRALGNERGGQVRHRIAEAPDRVQRHRHLARKNRSAERPQLQLLQDLAGSAEHDRLPGARPAADEVIRVRQRISYPGPPRRAQRHESQELRPVHQYVPGAADRTSSRGTSRACRARSS